jgi:putative hydrolase of the HAD superfamily
VGGPDVGGLRDRDGKRGGAPVEAVIFDWGGTLTRWHPIDIAETWRCVARVVHSADAAAAAALAARLFEVDETAWARSRDGCESSRFADVLAACELVESAELLAAHVELWEPRSAVEPDVPALLGGLKDRGIRVGLLSNTIWPRAQHEAWLARDGVAALFDGAVYSSEIPWVKPHPEAFRAAMAAVGVRDPARVVFVGDRPFEDIHGAKRVGMRAVLVPYTEIPPEAMGPVQGEADAVLERLLDLLPLVDAWAEV